MIMIINVNHTWWNLNKVRSFYTSIEDFIENRQNDVDRIRNKSAIINSDTIETWDLRSTTIISFENKEDKFLFLNTILWS